MKENVEITCVGCQFNSGAKIIEDMAQTMELNELLQSIDLVYDTENTFNPNAVAWCWIERTEDGYDEHKIGYVPENELDDVRYLLENAVDGDVPCEVLEIKKTGRGEIQWIRFGCMFELN